MMKENSNKIVYFAIILGICLIISALIGSFTFYLVKSPEGTLSVTGSVRERVTSDTVKWTSDFSRIVPAEEQSSGFQMMRSDQTKVLNFFDNNGFTEEDLIISPVFRERLWLYDPNAPRENVLRQTEEIR